MSFGSLFATTFTWNTDSAGDWNTAGNWTPGGGPPDDSSDDAIFGSIITADRAINVQSTSYSLDTLEFDNANKYTLSGTATLSPEDIIVTSGSHEIQNPAFAFFTVDVAAGETLTVSGEFDAFANWTKESDGELILSGTASNSSFDSSGYEINGGTLTFAKTGGATAIGSTNIQINSGATLKIDGTGQVPSDFVLLLEGGTFDLDGNAVLMSQIGVNPGTSTVTHGGGTLSLSSAFPIDIDGSVSFDGPVSLTNASAALLIHDSSVGAISTSFNEIDYGTADFTIVASDTTNPIMVSFTDVISGSGTFVIGIDNTDVTFTQSSPNTFTGKFFWSSQDLTLNGTATSIPRDLEIEDSLSIGSKVIVSQPGQFGGGSSQSDVTLISGELDISGSTGGETIQSFDFQSGTYTGGSETLTINGTGTNALTMRDVTISGPIAFTGGSDGAVKFDNTNDGTATISGTIDLGGIEREFNIENGSASSDMTISGVMSNGGITKEGDGTLSLTAGSDNTFSNDVTVNGGILRCDSSATSLNGFGIFVNVNAGGTLTSAQSSQIANMTGLIIDGGELILESSVSEFTGGNALSNGATITKEGANATTFGGQLQFTLADTSTFDVSNAGGTLSLISSPISGTGGFEKIGPGTLDLEGPGNFFSGQVEVSAGTLTLDTNGNAVPGDLLISGGTVQLLDTDQIGNTSDVSITSGSLDLNSMDDTFNSLTVSSGTVSNISTLTLNKADGAVVVTTDLALGGTVEFAGAASATSIVDISGSSELSFVGVDLGSETRVFGPTTANDSCVITGVISESGGTGSFTKDGLGPVTIQGSTSNTFSGTTTVDQGVLLLDHSSGNAIAGDVVVNSGGTLCYEGSDQIANSSTVTVSGGTLELDGTISDTLNAIDCSSGAMITKTGSGTGSLTATSSTFTGTTAISVASPSGALTFTSPISGTGAINKIGSGELILSGAGNTATGQTMVSDGTLALNSSGQAVSGPLMLNGGTVRLDASDQIATSVDVTQMSGTFDLNGNSNEIATFTFQSGTYPDPSGGILTLNSTSSALTMRDTTINGTVNLSSGSGGDVVFDSANNGSATIANMTLGSVLRTFTVPSGTADIDMALNGGSASGTGGIEKEGAGTLQLNNTHTYGNVSIMDGTLQVDGDVTSTTMTVESNGTLGGTGTVTADITFNGTVSPGASIGVLSLIGDQTFASGSTTVIEVSGATADLIDITGSLTIDPGVTLSIVELTPIDRTVTQTLIQTTTGISGIYSTISSNIPGIESFLSYTSDALLLLIEPAPFTSIVSTGNAGSTAAYLDTLNPAMGTDLFDVLASLDTITDPDELEKALNQLQPSHLKGLAMAVENITFRVKDAAFKRTREIYRAICKSELTSPKVSVWADFYGDYYKQEKEQKQTPFNARSLAALGGVDYQGIQNYLFGAYTGYSYTDVNWKKNAGDGNIRSIYLSAYGNLFRDLFYVNASLLGAYNQYREVRKIKFTTFDRRAKGSFHGGEFLAHLDGGLIFTHQNYSFRPFAMFDYTVFTQGTIRESGANSLNLVVDKSRYDMLRMQGGLFASRCFNLEQSKFLLDGKLSYIREQRFEGREYKSHLKGEPGSFATKGMHPDRNLFSPSFGFSYFTFDEKIIVALRYEAEIGSHMWDQNVNFKVTRKF